MSDVPLQSPVLFVIFNRLDTAQRVFDAIRQARPERLFVAADGPREDMPGEAATCARVRRIIDTIDWDCNVVKLFHDKNLGCKSNVSSAIDWFFDNVEEGIILEDDCLPSRSFFRFCQELLAYYRDDTRIMQICGTNVLKEWNRSGQSCFFSAYGPVWGWASWRRAWRHYDVNMELWPEIRRNGFYVDMAQNEDEAVYRRDLYDKVFRGEIDTWDYQWGFAKMINHGLSVIPAVNLISNIGFDAGATHTAADQSNPYANMEINNMHFPLAIPSCVICDRMADQRYVREFMSIMPAKRSLVQTLLRLARRTGQ